MAGRRRPGSRQEPEGDTVTASLAMTRAPVTSGQFVREENFNAALRTKLVEEQVAEARLPGRPPVEANATSGRQVQLKSLRI